jgi:uncharacterized protein
MRVRRQPGRAAYDRAVVRRVLDAGWLAHVGFVGAHGPVVIPTAYARVGDTVVMHGARASQLAGAGRRGGVPVCVTVTLVDGLVLARSAFHHSVNYRSVMIHGTAREVLDPQARSVALDALVDQVLPGRSGEARPADERELRLTSVIAVDLDEAVAKINAATEPKEEPADLDLAVWAGIVPLALVAGAPVPDAGTRAGRRPVPASVSAVLARR